MSDPIIDPLGSYSCSTDGYYGAGWSGYGSGYGGSGSGFGGWYGSPGYTGGFGAANLAVGYPKADPTPGRYTIPIASAWTFDPEAVLTLSHRTDEVLYSQGPVVYDRMDADDQVVACAGLLVYAVTGGELTIEPAVVPEPGERLDDETEPQRRRDIEDAARNADEFRRAVNAVPDFIPQIRATFRSGSKWGCGLAEPLWVKDGDAGLITLGGLMARPRGAWTWLVNLYGKPVGVAVWTAGGPMAYDRNNYLIYSHAPINGHPEGTSDYRAAYDPWLFKTHSKIEKSAWLKKFADPSLVMKYDHEQQELKYTNEQGQVAYMTPMEQAEWIGRNFAGGSRLSIPLNWDATLIESKSDGGAFNAAEEAYNKAIARAFLGTGTATNEAERNSVAQAGQSDNVFQAKVNACQRDLADAIRRDLAAEMTVRNHGEKQRRLAPRVHFQVPRHIIAELWTAFAALKTAGVIPPSIAPKMYPLVDMPTPNPDDFVEGKWPWGPAPAPLAPLPGATPVAAVAAQAGKSGDGKMNDGKDGKPATGKPAPPLGGKVRKVADDGAAKAKDQVKE